MGRGRGKGKKLTISNHDDAGSGEEEKIPSQKRRGRPQKPLKDEIDDEEVEKLEEENGENGKADIATNDGKSPSAVENGKKRKRNSQVKEKTDSVKEENVFSTRSSTDDSSKSNGFRQNGSRRKSKPRRAAEAVVECKVSLSETKVASSMFADAPSFLQFGTKDEHDRGWKIRYQMVKIHNCNHEHSCKKNMTGVFPTCIGPLPVLEDDGGRVVVVSVNEEGDYVGVGGDVFKC